MKFSKKTAHRLIVSLAMLAPVVYLFGAMFLGLAGAHGEQIYAEPVYVEEFVSVDNYVDDGTLYKFVINTEEQVKSLRSPAGYTTANFSYTFKGIEKDSFRFGLYNNSYYFIICGYEGAIDQIYTYYPSTDNLSINSALPWTFDFTYIPYSVYSWLFEVGELYRVEQVPTDVVPENNSAYTELIFGNFFPKDNFLERIGVNALSSNPIGFAPFGTFLSYLDLNVFHASGSQVALMLYGMVYWSLHVIIADLVYHVAVFIPNIIQRVFDWFGQKGLEDD